MTPLGRVLCLGLVAFAATAQTASAQYYAPPPPPPGPYYAPQQPPPGPYYSPAPPPPEQRYYGRRFGGRCEAFRPDGRQIVCELARPKALGDGCVCPPRFAGGPYLEGRVIP